MNKLLDFVAHPLFIRAFAWFMSPEQVRVRIERREARRAARRERRKG